MKEIDTQAQGYPTCPHCGSTFHDWWDTASGKDRNDGDTWEVCCANCGKDYMTTIFITHHFDSEKTE